MAKVEEEMSQFGAVAGCSKDYVEVRGCRIENERRNVLFTVLVDKAAVIDSELDMFGLSSSIHRGPLKRATFFTTIPLFLGGF